MKTKKPEQSIAQSVIRKLAGTIRHPIVRAFGGVEERTVSTADTYPSRATVLLHQGYVLFFWLAQYRASRLQVPIKIQVKNGLATKDDSRVIVQNATSGKEQKQHWRYLAFLLKEQIGEYSPSRFDLSLRYVL